MQFELEIVEYSRITLCTRLQFLKISKDHVSLVMLEDTVLYYFPKGFSEVVSCKNRTLIK